MQGVKRKVVYVSLYEGIAIVVATLGLAGMSGQDVHTAGGVAVAASVIAILWNLAFNTMFEAWEARQAVKGRSLKRRIAHAIGFVHAFLQVVDAAAGGPQQTHRADGQQRAA